MTARARALITGETVMLSFPYDKGLIHRLKAEIPPPCRTFDERTKTWTVFQPHVMAAVGIVYDYFPDLIIEDGTGSRASWRSSTRSTKKDTRTDPDYAALHLLPTAPDPLVDAAYRCLARLHHPDAGGDTTAMQQLNAAHEAIRARRAS